MSQSSYGYWFLFPSQRQVQALQLLKRTSGIKGRVSRTNWRSHLRKIKNHGPIWLLVTLSVCKVRTWMRESSGHHWPSRCKVLSCHGDGGANNDRTDNKLISRRGGNRSLYGILRSGRARHLRCYLCGTLLRVCTALGTIKLYYFKPTNITIGLRTRFSVSDYKLHFLRSTILIQIIYSHL